MLRISVRANRYLNISYIEKYEHKPRLLCRRMNASTTQIARNKKTDNTLETHGIALILACHPPTTHTTAANA